jgi:hypothetical protein
MMEEKALEFFLFCLAGFCVNEIGQRALKFGRTNYYFITFYLWLRSLHFSQWSDIQSVDVGRSEWFRQRHPMLVSPLASGAFLRISSISLSQFVRVLLVIAILVSLRCLRAVTLV